MNATIRSHIEITFGNQRVQLRGDGSVFLVQQESLLVADLHLGKDASFRHAGIPVPGGINKKTLELLGASIRSSEAESIFILGDLIHDGNSMTPELVQMFATWRSSFKKFRFTLVRGNHDRYVDQFPQRWQLETHSSIELGDTELVHETTADSSKTKGKPQIGGHLHPVVTVGRGADEMRLPCFVVDDHTLTLPAFGPFKGGMKQQRAPRRKFYPVCEGKIWLDQSRSSKRHVPT